MSSLAVFPLRSARSLLATQGTCAPAGLGIRSTGPRPAGDYVTSKNQAFHGSRALVQGAGLKPEGVT